MTGKHSNTKKPPQPDTAAAPAEAKSISPADITGVLKENKGKLAIGVAATLGLMIFYNWRQKNLPKEDPEAYARLQRIKNSVKADDAHAKHEHDRKHRKDAAAKDSIAPDPDGSA
ncbi:MAG: hypothetical protein V7642_5982 [Burkholderiales bacterium]